MDVSSETNGNLASSGGGSLTSLTGSPALKRRGDSAKGMDKSSANFLDYYLSLESAVRQKREASGEQIPPVSAAPSTDNAISVANTNSPSGDHNREKGKGSYYDCYSNIYTYIYVLEIGNTSSHPFLCLKMY